MNPTPDKRKLTEKEANKMAEGFYKEQSDKRIKTDKRIKIKE